MFEIITEQPKETNETVEPGGNWPFLNSLQILKRLPFSFAGFFQFVYQGTEKYTIRKFNQTKVNLEQSIPKIRRQILFLLDPNPQLNDDEDKL